MIAISRRTKIIVPAVAFLGLVVLASCATDGATTQGGSASIAEAVYRATATAEYGATSTRAASIATEQHVTAVAISTQIADAGVKATLDTYDRAMSGIALSNTIMQATHQSVMVKATATEVYAQATQQAAMRTATAEAIVVAQSQSEASNRFWDWTLLALFLLGFIISFGGVSFLFWWLWIRHGVINRMDGSIVILRNPISIILDKIGRCLSTLWHGGKQPPVQVRPLFDIVPAPVPVALLASANTAADRDYRPGVITANNFQRVVNMNEKSEREILWEKFVKDLTVFTTDVYEYCDRESTSQDKFVPRWDSLKKAFPDRVYINSRWWMTMTDALVELGALIPKEQGKKTQINDGGDSKIKNVVQLHVAAVRGRLCPPTPPEWFTIVKNGQEQLQPEQSEQPEQSNSGQYLDGLSEAGRQILDGAVDNLPRGN